MEDLSITETIPETFSVKTVSLNPLRAFPIPIPPFVVQDFTGSLQSYSFTSPGDGICNVRFSVQINSKYGNVPQFPDVRIDCKIWQGEQELGLISIFGSTFPMDGKDLNILCSFATNIDIFFENLYTITVEGYPIPEGSEGWIIDPNGTVRVDFSSL